MYPYWTNNLARLTRLPESLSTFETISRSEGRAVGDGAAVVAAVDVAAEAELVDADVDASEVLATVDVDAVVVVDDSVLDRVS